MENKKTKNMANAWMVACHSHYCIFTLIILRITIINIGDAKHFQHNKFGEKKSLPQDCLNCPKMLQWKNKKTFG